MFGKESGCLFEANNMSSVSHSITRQWLVSSISFNLLTIFSEASSPPYLPTSPTRNASSSTNPDPPCDISNTLRYLLDPCQHDGTCVNNGSDPDGYTCQCSWGFDGDRCERDIRPCKPDTCWNNGAFIGFELK